ncbi:macrolide family glycosyltransferase [Streptomyces cyanogenus]|uniref:Oleandomycin glycosyltransferase n=1 Tax=Streptomyces cyanogenus TaxID=80860 RepID=A0ABX7U1W4_STRCY|nr:macrolide family glycosyltransferase [Streptomyces cyanogenus]QTE03028.1 Oleandomycin glycosyltransferase [Streptomyces cyanogenus]
MSGDSRPAHVAFFALPGHGHVNPALGVAAELTRRGHRVTFATTDRFATAAAATGAVPLRYESTMDGLPAKDSAADRPDRFGSDDLARVLRDLLRETVAVLGPLDRAFAQDRPDLVVYDDPSGWAARLIAARRGIPVLPYRTTFAAGAGWSLATHRTDVDPSHPEIMRVFHAVTTLLDRLKVPLGPKELMTGSESGPALVCIPREFQFRGETFGEDFHFVGPCWSERRFDGEWSRPGDGSGERPLVLVSLGTIHNDDVGFFQACVDAFAGLPWDVVMAVGDRVDPGVLSGVPAHVQVRAHVPQLRVLREADLFVTHAGMGSVMESLFFGVPMVAIPQMSEQRANADRLVGLGLGVMLHRREVTAASLREAARAVLADSSYGDRVRDMRGHVRRAGGAPAAADVIESLLTASAQAHG